MATKVRNAVLVRRVAPVFRSSATTSTWTSIDVVDVNDTRADSRAIWPMRIGASNERSSIDAVTQSRRECRCAVIAATTSIQCITVPPSTFPSGFVSLGSTSCTISVADSCAALGARSAGFAGETAIGPPRLLVAAERARGEDVLVRRLGGRVRLRLGPRQGVLDLLLHLGLHLLRIVRGEHSLLEQQLLEARQRILRLPGVHLVVAPVVRRVDLGVAVPAVGLALDQGRALARAGAGDRL